MRVLVTGAGGFAGGQVARRLAEAGFEVIATTRRSPVAPPANSAAARRFRVIVTPLDAAAVLPTAIDAIVHAAATSIWAGITVDRMATDNVVATQAVARHALAAKVRAFILFSSVSAFGTIRVPRLTEAVPSTEVDAYGATKLLCEQLLADVADRLPSLALRLPAIIGHGSRRNWPSECLRKLKSGEPLEAFNPNTPFNNLIHDADLARLAATALNQGMSGAEMVVLGSAGRITIAEAVQILAEDTGSRSAISWAQRDHPAFLIDSSKAARLFGFAPLKVDEALRQFAVDNS